MATRKDVQPHPGQNSAVPKVRDLDRTARAAALAAAARQADDTERTGFVHQLVDIAAAPDGFLTTLASRLATAAARWKIKTAPPQPSILVSVVSVWDLVESDARKVFIAISPAGVLDAAVAVLSSSDARTRRAAVLALKDLASPGSLRALLAPLTDHDPTVASLADRTFGAIVHHWVQEGLHLGDLAKHLPDIGDTIISACLAAGRERLKGPPLAAIELLSPEYMMPSAASRIGVLPQWLTTQGGQDPGLRRTLRGLKGPLCRLRAWQWLAHRELASVCTDRLARAHDSSEHESLLSSAHLLLNPRRRAAAVGIGKVAGLNASPARVQAGEVAATASAVIPIASAVPQSSEVPELSLRSKWGLTHIVPAIGMSSARRRALLDPLLTDDSPGVRLSAARGGG
jgi:hypothetical protein